MLVKKYTQRNTKKVTVLDEVDELSFHKPTLRFFILITVVIGLLQVYPSLEDHSEDRTKCLDIRVVGRLVNKLHNAQQRRMTSEERLALYLPNPYNIPAPHAELLNDGPF